MFVGHLAIGLTAKRIEPKVSLGTWVLAALLADLLAFPLLILGIEHFAEEPGTLSNRIVGRDIVYSHSLLMVAIYSLCSRWSIFCGGATGVARGFLLVWS